MVQDKLTSLLLLEAFQERKVGLRDCWVFPAMKPIPLHDLSCRRTLKRKDCCCLRESGETDSVIASALGLAPSRWKT